MPRKPKTKLRPLTAVSPWLAPIDPERTPALTYAIVAAIINAAQSFGIGSHTHVEFRVEQRQVFVHQSGLFGASMRFYLVPGGARPSSRAKGGRPRHPRLRVVMIAPNKGTKHPRIQRIVKVRDIRLMPNTLNACYDEQYAAVMHLICASFVRFTIVRCKHLNAEMAGK